MFPATLFDYNGVLIDDEVVHLEAFRDVLSPLGIRLSEDDYWKRYLGFDDAGAFRAILSDNARNCTATRNPSPHRSEAAPLSRPRPRRAGGFAGAAELLQRRAAAGPVVMVSGALRDEIALGLSVLNAENTVRAIVSAEIAALEPHPAGLPARDEGSALPSATARHARW